MNHSTQVSAGLAAALVLVGSARSQFTLGEVFANPPGVDQGLEAIEIRGPASGSLSGWFLLSIDGDGLGAAGTIDQRIDLGALACGVNGLLLLRDAATVLDPAPHADTVVSVCDFTPDIENGSNTFVLGSGAPPALGADVDPEDDGTLDLGLFAAFTVADAVSIIEGDGAANFGYAGEFGAFFVQPQFSYAPDAIVRLYDADASPCGWAGGDVLGTGSGPFTWDFEAAEVFGGLTDAYGPQELSLGSFGLALDLDGDGASDACDGCVSDPAKTDPGTCGCLVPEGCSLGIDVGAISASAGGTQSFGLFAGAANAGSFFLMLGSISGTVPGTPVESVVLPLNVDGYLLFLLSAPSSVVMPSFGFLDGTGGASSALTVPPGTALPGLPITMHHAYLLIDPVTGFVVFASNATTLDLLP